MPEQPRTNALAECEPILSPEHRAQVLAYLSQGTGLADALALLRLPAKRVMGRLRRLRRDRVPEAVELTLEIDQARARYVRQLHTALSEATAEGNAAKINSLVWLLQHRADR